MNKSMTPDLKLSPNANASLNKTMAQRAALMWQTLAPREQLFVSAALTLVVLALVWWLALAPALGVLKTADAKRAELDRQLQQMQALQLQAKALQAQPKVTVRDAARELEVSVRQQLGTTAQLSVAGSQATLTLKNAPAAALAQWLGQARTTARALPSQARLRASTTAPGTWDGTLVLQLPAQL